MTLDSEALRKLALAGARAQLKDLEAQVEDLRNTIRQLSGASIPADERRKKEPAKKTHRPGAGPARPARRKRRMHSDMFRARVVKEAEASNASAIGKKYELSPSLVRRWIEQAK